MEILSKMNHPELLRAYVGLGTSAGAGGIGWFASNMSLLQGVSLIVSIIAGALTIVYTLKKIFFDFHK